jgi:alpha-1,2-mannosyltransferase
MHTDTSEASQGPSRAQRSQGPSRTQHNLSRLRRVLLRRPATAGGRIGLIAVNLACLAAFLFAFPHGHGMAFGPYRVDLDVYRIGGRAWLNGVHLYGPLPRTVSGARLPFTYPPVAAILLSPLSMVPMAVASALLTAASVGLLALVLLVCLRSLDQAGEQLGGWAVWWLLPLALALEPVRNTLAYGQVNIALMALVAVDCLAPSTRWPRGTLVGLAAAIKLTPAAFVLFFLLRRDWRAAGMAAASFLAATGVGFLLAWHDSVQYWTRTVFDASRVGGLPYAANQSVVGVLARVGLGHPALAEVWLVVAVAVVGAAWRGMRQSFVVSQDCLAMSLNGFAALLISPISWSHQWVWCVPALVALAAAGLRHKARGPLAITAAGMVIFAAGPQWWFPNGQSRELDWSAWQQIVGSAYVGFAAIILVIAAVGMSGLMVRSARRQSARLAES